ncbi:MAG TPA: tRNA dihydrouridine synthase DusB, partial [Verrucomicrobiae bacterium]|nr:tRNA dihydrouridine synthase DusB [Verrucomicrobiae bacterium]
LALVDSLARLDELLARLDRSVPWPGEPSEGPRGRTGSARRVALPDGWLASPELSAVQRRLVAQAELDVSGG